MPQTETQRTTVTQSDQAFLEFSGDGAATGDVRPASRGPSGDGAAGVEIEQAPRSNLTMAHLKRT